MKILETEQGWAVEHNGTLPVKIEGTGYFEDKAVLKSAIKKRGLYIWRDGSIQKRPEPRSQEAAKDDEAFEAAAPKSSSGAPPTEDPPVDPDADKDRPKPSPKPTAPGKRASGGKLTAKQAKAVSDKLAVTKGDNILSPTQVEAVGGKKAIATLTKAAKSKAEPEKPTRGRGRPRLYTEEEAKQRRREKAKEYAANRSEEQKAAARERARKWREEHPDKVKQAREKSMENRAKRYEEDPEYRKKFNEYQRQYKRAKRSGEQ